MVEKRLEMHRFTQQWGQLLKTITLKIRICIKMHE